GALRASKPHLCRLLHRLAWNERHPDDARWRACAHRRILGPAARGAAPARPAQTRTRRAAGICPPRRRRHPGKHHTHRGCRPLPHRPRRRRRPRHHSHRSRGRRDSGRSACGDRSQGAQSLRRQLAYRDRRRAGGDGAMKPVNQKAWFLVLPVLVLVALSALIPLMTVVNYSVQDTFGNNQFFWAGTAWYEQILHSERFWNALGRNLVFSGIILLIEIPLGVFVALHMPRRGWGVAVCLVLMALPLLIPWNVVGTIWQVFGRVD